MNAKKICSAIIALTCGIGMFFYIPIMTNVHAAEIVKNDFEKDYGGWHGSSDSVILKAENDKGYNNSRGMAVKNRKSKNDGAQSSKGFYLTGNTEYNYNVEVYSKTNEIFSITLTYIDENTEKETTVLLVQKNTSGGK